MAVRRDSVKTGALMRVFFAALALCVISFAAGIAGDLSIAAPTPPSVIVQLPPPIPANAVRAHPLPPLSTARPFPPVAHAVAGEVNRPRLEMIAARSKPRTEQGIIVAKVDLDRAPKDDGPTSAQI